MPSEGESSFFIGGFGEHAAPQDNAQLTGLQLHSRTYTSCQSVSSRKLSVSITASREPAALLKGTLTATPFNSALVIGCQSLSPAPLWGSSVYSYFCRKLTCVPFLPDKSAELFVVAMSAASLFLLLASELNRLRLSYGSYRERLVAEHPTTTTTRPISHDSCGSMPIDSSPFQLALCKHLDAGRLRRYRCW